MKEYEEYLPLERTEADKEQIAGYTQLLGKPQFPTSHSDNNI